MDKEFWKDYKDHLSVGETLHKRIIKLMEIKGMSTKEFYDKTELTPGYLKRLEDCRVRRELTTIVTICIGMELEPMDSLELIRLAGYYLCDKVPLEYAYMELIYHYNEAGIKNCNDRLEELGIAQKHFLGSKEYSKCK